MSGELRNRDWVSIFATVMPTIGSLVLVWWNLVTQIAALEKRISVFEAVKGPIDQMTEMRFHNIESRLNGLEGKVDGIEQYQRYWLGEEKKK